MIVKKNKNAQNNTKKGNLMIDMNIEEARYIVCNVYESYRRLLHLPPKFLEEEILNNVMKEKNSFKSDIAKNIINNSLEIYDEIVEPILKKFPELTDELEAQKKEDFNVYPCQSKT